jgi:hypothetical protein
MRNRRLLILIAAIAVVAAGAYVLMPRSASESAAPAVAVRPAPSVAAPAAPPEPAQTAPVAPDREAPPSKATKLPDPADGGEEAAPVAPAAAPEPEQEPPGIPPADPEKAADLFADILAKQETEPSGPNALPNPARDLWKKFGEEKADDAWSPAATGQLQDSLDEWIDGLPDGTGDHVALVHVECRATLCQVLAADNDLAGQSSRADAGQEWQQAIAQMRSQPWWNDSGFTDMTTQITSSDGYTLYITYLLHPQSAPSP